MAASKCTVLLLTWFDLFWAFLSNEVPHKKSVGTKNTIKFVYCCTESKAGQKGAQFHFSEGDYFKNISIFWMKDITTLVGDLYCRARVICCSVSQSEGLAPTHNTIRVDSFFNPQSTNKMCRKRRREVASISTGCNVVLIILAGGCTFHKGLKGCVRGRNRTLGYNI